MGASIARRLIAKGIKTQIYVRSAERAKMLSDLAMFQSTTAAQTVRGANIILSCVTDDEASRSVWFGANGACDATTPGTICLELSTLSTSWTDEWISQLNDLGLTPVDCPVTGSRSGAEAGTLIAFIGAAPPQNELVETVLRQITSQCIYFHKPGDAMRFKLAYNMIGASICAAFAEGLAVMNAAGLDMEAALSALAEGGWTGAITKSKGSSMLSHDYIPPAFRTALMRKDIRYAAQSFRHLALRTPVAETVYTLYDEACKAGYNDQDFSSIFEILDDGYER